MTATATRRASAVARAAAELLPAADVLAVFVFGFGGAVVAIDAGAGLGVTLFMAFLSALGGGIVRDLAVRRAPVTLRTPTLPAAAVAAGLTAFVLRGQVQAIPYWSLTTLDAAALALFCAAGALAVTGRAGITVAVLLGAVSAVGGGVLRDLLLGHPPTAVTGSLPALPAAVGAATAVACSMGDRSRGLALGMGIAVAFTIRMLSLWHGLPQV